MIVAKLNKDQAQKYLAIINGVWKTKFKLSDLKQRKDKLYYILVAGECRLRSHKVLKWPEIESRIPKEKEPMAILKNQFIENVRVVVPKQEDAISLACLYRFLKQTEPNYTRARFAREMGRSPDVIRDAERFCDMSEFIFRAAMERIDGKYLIP